MVGCRGEHQRRVTTAGEAHWERLRRVGSFEDRVVGQSVVHMPMEGAGLGSSAPKVEHGRAG
jgi:hypothetical protein